MIVSVFSSMDSLSAEDRFMVPEINRNPRDISDVTANGFTVEWNVPGPSVLPLPGLLTGYQVFISEVGGQRKRQAAEPIAFTGPEETSYTFTDGEPFTQYSVDVDGVVSVDGRNATVAALAGHITRTDEGSKLWSVCV